MNVFISGFYGFDNVGDELVLSKIIEDIKGIDKDAKIVVWSGNVEKTRLIHNVEAVSRFDINETEESVKCSDVIIVGGGGLVHEYLGIDLKIMFTNFGYDISAYSIIPLLSNIYEKPVFYWSQGVGPFFSDKGRQFSKWFYSLANCITVRDEYSYFLIKSISPEIKHIYLDTDPVTNLNLHKFIEKNKFSIPNNKLKLGINLRPWFGQDEIIKKIAHAIERLLEDVENIVIIPIPFDLNSDKDILKSIMHHFPDDRVENRCIESMQFPADVLSLMDEVDFFIGMRLHSIITANILKKPSIALVYDKKVESFAKNFDIDSIFMGDLDESNLYSLMKNLIQNPKKIFKENITYKTPEIFVKFLNNDLNKNIIVEPKVTNKEVDDVKFDRSLMQSFKREIEKLNNENIYLLAQLEKVKKNYYTVSNEKNKLSNKLDEIYSSNFWKIARTYYKIKNKSHILRKISNIIKFK